MSKIFNSSFQLSKLIKYTNNNSLFIPPRSKHWIDTLVTKSNEAYQLHKNIPEYKVTPLMSLKGLASKLNVNNIFIKNEQPRFNMNAFKGLGGSYSVMKIMEQKWKEKSAEPFPAADYFKSTDTIDFLDDKITFCAATDGNHGRAVSWAASLFKQPCIVYVPRGTAKFRKDNIRAYGANVIELDLDYDQTVEYAYNISKEKKWVLVSDTATYDDTDTPCNVMAGYQTLFREISDQLKTCTGNQIPSHVFLQAGVGGMAGAGCSHFVNLSRELSLPCPKIIIVEPFDADCFYQSNLHQNMVKSKGSLNSIMNGLNCGTCSTVGYDIISSSAYGYINIDDDFAKEAVRALFYPFGQDISIVSGESGASGLAGLLASAVNHYDDCLFDKHSNIVVVSTEGDTDPDLYREIIKIKPKLI